MFELGNLVVDDEGRKGRVVSISRFDEMVIVRYLDNEKLSGWQPRSLFAEIKTEATCETPSST